MYINLKDIRMFTAVLHWNFKLLEDFKLAHPGGVGSMFYLLFYSELDSEFQCLISTTLGFHCSCPCQCWWNGKKTSGKLMLTKCTDTQKLLPSTKSNKEVNAKSVNVQIENSS